MKKQIIRIVCVVALLCVSLFCAACDEGSNPTFTDSPTVETPSRDTVNGGFAGTYPPEDTVTLPPVTDSGTESEDAGTLPPSGEIYIVLFDSNGGTDVNRQTIYEGNPVNKPDDPTKTDFIFVGWYLGEEAWDFENDVVTDDITLTAKWTPVTYTVTFNSDGGSNVASQQVEKGGLVVKPSDPIKTDSVFIGWFNGSTPWNFETDTVTEDITLTARWNWLSDSTTYVVTFYSDGGSTVAPQSVVAGSYAIRPEDPTKPGYSFEGWYLFGGATEWVFINMPVTESITLVAKWKEIPIEETDVPPEVPNAPIITLGTVNSTLTTTLQAPPTYSDVAVEEDQPYLALSKDAKDEGLVIKMNERAYSAFRAMAQQFNRDTRGGTVAADTGDVLVVHKGTTGKLITLRVKTLRKVSSVYQLEEASIRASSTQQRVKNTAEWLSRHAATYGFVNTASQSSYRYVGAGIALALQKRNEAAGTSIDVDAYLAEVAASYKASGQHLTVTTNDGAVYEIWYAEKDASGKVKLPSGKDMDLVAHENGYIVSVKTH